jgi:hypothetical protein
MMASQLWFVFLKTYSSEQVQNQYDQQNGAEDSEAAAGSPSRVAVVSAASTEQQDQNNDEQ